MFIRTSKPLPIGTEVDLEVAVATEDPPITVRGTLRHPSVGISATKALGQGGIAAALAALTPVAALLAFVDPGLAKNEDCLALMQSANEAGLPTRTAQP